MGWGQPKNWTIFSYLLKKNNREKYEVRGGKETGIYRTQPFM